MSIYGFDFSKFGEFWQKTLGANPETFKKGESPKMTSILRRWSNVSNDPKSPSQTQLSDIGVAQKSDQNNYSDWILEKRTANEDTYKIKTVNEENYDLITPVKNAGKGVLAGILTAIPAVCVTAMCAVLFVGLILFSFSCIFPDVREKYPKLLLASGLGTIVLPFIPIIVGVAVGFGVYDRLLDFMRKMKE